MTSASTAPVAARDRLLVSGRLIDLERASRTAEVVRRSVRALAAFYGIPAETMAKALRMSRATWFTRIGGKTDFSIGETAVLADIFQCSVDDLTSGNISVQIAAAEEANTRSLTHDQRVMSKDAEVIDLRPALGGATRKYADTGVTPRTTPIRNANAAKVA